MEPLLSGNPVSAPPVRPPDTIRGACGHDCPDTCGWVVEVKDGRATRLEGDKSHPFTRGGLCAKVNHYLEKVYHPERVLHPMKRVGRKGEGRFERVTWDEALSDIAARWQRIIAESGAEAIVPHSSAGVQGLIQMASIDRRLFGAMGCSQLQRAICGSVAAAGMATTLGVGSGIDPEDVVHSRYIVLWGTNTIVTNLHYWPYVREAQSRGAQARGRRSGTHAHRGGRGLAPAGQTGKRRGACPRDDARDGARLPGRSRLRLAPRRGIRRPCRTRPRLRAPGGVPHRRPHRRRDRTLRARIRDHATVPPASADRTRASQKRSDAVPRPRVPAGVERSVPASRRRYRPIDACAPVRSPRHEERGDARGLTSPASAP